MIDVTHFLNEPLVLVETHDVKKCLGCMQKYKEYKSLKKLHAESDKAIRWFLEKNDVLNCTVSCHPHERKKKVVILSLHFTHYDDNEHCGHFKYEQAFKVYNLINENDYILQSLSDE